MTEIEISPEEIATMQAQAKAEGVSVESLIERSFYEVAGVAEIMEAARLEEMPVLEYAQQQAAKLEMTLPEYTLHIGRLVANVTPANSQEKTIGRFDG